MMPVVIAGVVGASALGYFALRSRARPSAAPLPILAEARVYSGLDQPDGERLWLIVQGKDRPAVIEMKLAALYDNAWWTLPRDQPSSTSRLYVRGAATRVPMESSAKAADAIGALIVSSFDPTKWAGAELTYHVGGDVEPISSSIDAVRKTQSGWWTGDVMTALGEPIAHPQGETLGDLLESWAEGVRAQAEQSGWEHA